MADLNQDPDRLVYQATRTAERLRKMQALAEHLPSRRAKGTEMTALRNIIDETHELLQGYDMQPESPAIAEQFDSMFEACVEQLYSLVAQAKSAGSDKVE